MHTNTELKKALDEAGLKLVEFDENTKETKDKLNEKISVMDEMKGSAHPFEAAVIGT
jgi:hypothetical protein